MKPGFITKTPVFDDSEKFEEKYNLKMEEVEDMQAEDKEKKLKEAFDVYENFKSDFDFTQQHSKSFAELMWEIMRERKVTYLTPTKKQVSAHIRDRNHFANVTGLGPSTYDRIKSGRDDYVPSIKTFMTLCIIYDLNITMVKNLRHTYGYDFNAKDQVHQAYIYLLVNCRGKSLSYCNKTLEALGIEEKYYLGDGRIDEKDIRIDLFGEDDQ